MSKKVEKALGSLANQLERGESISMYNNEYKVLSEPGGDQTIFQDSKGLMLAMPTVKVKFLLKKNLIQRLYKSQTNEIINGPLSPREFVKNQLVKAAKEQAALTEAPLHTIHNERIKVRMDPPKWVHAVTGRSYDSHDSDKEHHDLHHEVDLANAQKFYQNIVSKTHPEDHEKLKNMVTGFLGKQRCASNMKSVHKGAIEGGRKPPESLFDTTFNLHSDAAKAWKSFTNAYKASVMKVKSGGK